MRYALLIMMILMGCGSVDNAPTYTDISPDGYKVNIPESVYQHGLYYSDYTETSPENIRIYILNSVDYWISEWIKSHPERESVNLEDIAHSYVFIIHDHFGIRSDLSRTGIVGGLCHYTEGFIELPLYLEWFEDYLPFPNYPPYLMFSSEEMYEWTGKDFWLQNPRKYVTGFSCDDIERQCSGLVFIPHELDHAIGIHHPI